MDRLEETHTDITIIPGIDLGTTNSCISVWRNNNCEIIPDEYGNKTIPSFVSYTNVSKYVGIDAKKQKDINIENVFYEVKRLIGRSFNDKMVQLCKNLLSYTIIENDRGCISLQSTIRNNKVFTPEEISASILIKLKDMANKYLKREIKDVVITVPAHFNDSQRQATKDAASIAGLNCVRMIHEPTAAALAYGMMDRSVNKALNTANNLSNDCKGMLILVYDLGGGTLDVSLIDVYDGCFDVQGSSGISHFGGTDFDNRLINYCITKFSRQYYGTIKLETSKFSRTSLQKLRTQCESAKKILSTNTQAYVAIEDFHDGKNLFVKITRNDFENLCLDLFLLCLSPVNELLEECGKSDADIDEIILVGGMTRMPYIRELLNNKFRDSNRKSRVNCSINPDEAVSVGAAVQGYIIANRDDAFSDSVTLLDVTPLSLGVEVIGGVMDILIKRNTMIPCEKSKLYTTDTDYVDSVLIKIFEGERSMTSNNYKIGEFELDKIPMEQRGIPEIEICFSIDINGIVTVTATENDFKEQKSIIVNTNKDGLKPHQLQALIEEAHEQEAMDELERVKKYNYYEIEDLCCNIINNINNKEFKLTKKDVETINEDIAMIREWLKDKTYRDRELTELEDILNKIKKKYGVLIIHGRLEDNKVKASSDHLDATTIYGKEDDEDEEEMKQAFEKVQREDIGAEGMSNSEILEIKEMRNALIELCHAIISILNSGKMNISNEHVQEILHYIDDVMMWYYSHEKPTKMDYKEKIDYVNSICDEIVEKYKNEGKVLFKKSGMYDDVETNSQKLEKLCLTIITMIKNKQIMCSNASVVLLNNKLQNILKYVYTYDANNDNIIGEEFQKKCDEYIKEINDTCNNIYNNLQGISIKNGPILENAQYKSNIVTDPLMNNNENESKRGMSVTELMRIKQNEEIDMMIDRQISENDENNRSD